MTLRKTTTVLVGLMALFEIWAAIGVWTGAGAEDASDAGGATYGIPLLFAAALLLYGLWCRDSAPRRSTALIVVGAACPMAILFWMAPVFLLPWLLITAVALASTPRPRPVTPTPS